RSPLPPCAPFLRDERQLLPVQTSSPRTATPARSWLHSPRTRGDGALTPEIPDDAEQQERGDGDGVEDGIARDDLHLQREVHRREDAGDVDQTMQLRPFLPEAPDPSFRRRQGERDEQEEGGEAERDERAFADVREQPPNANVRSNAQ